MKGGQPTGCTSFRGAPSYPRTVPEVARIKRRTGDLPGFYGPRMGKNADDYADKYTKPQLRAELKEEIKAGDKGGNPGQWSARKSQMLVQRYEAEGGGYKDNDEQEEAAKSLSEWTEQDWQTKEGSAYADEDGEPMKRYLPAKAWDLLSEEEKQRTEKKKEEEGEDAGKQFVENTVEAKAARAYVDHGDASDLSVDPLMRLTKKELDNIARDADVDGRSKMDKEDLAHAIHEVHGGSDAEEATKAELYDEAKEQDIQGRSKMDKEELRDALGERGG